MGSTPSCVDFGETSDRLRHEIEVCAERLPFAPPLHGRSQRLPAFTRFVFRGLSAGPQAGCRCFCCVCSLGEDLGNVTIPDRATKTCRCLPRNLYLFDRLAPGQRWVVEQRHALGDSRLETILGFLAHARHREFRPAGRPLEKQRVGNCGVLGNDCVACWPVTRSVRPIDHRRGPRNRRFTRESLQGDRPSLLSGGEDARSTTSPFIAQIGRGAGTTTLLAPKRFGNGRMGC